MPTKVESLYIRKATREDVPLILKFIKELADYEKMLDQVVATEEIIEDSIFNRKKAEVVFAVYDGEEVGFALYFNNFSTFLGKPGLYLEDLYVREQMRGRGIGKTLLAYLAKTAVEQDCGRFEWWCLDWNKPSIDFYLKLGSIPMDEWTVYRVCDDALIELAKEF
ncbi:GNAT family N-acetyltransferase [Soehngenia longivitae]|uniref:GNAT family N-acetyltransferase n=1 Tax=Soehngenia longivitae TaxID=2562294 RepID=A0A4Z0D6B1_9FIRM|nr:GNAT family N-acetyltransferase [Soehngenia longivitae]